MNIPLSGTESGTILVWNWACNPPSDNAWTSLCALRNHCHPRVRQNAWTKKEAQGSREKERPVVLLGLWGEITGNYWSLQGILSPSEDEYHGALSGTFWLCVTSKFSCLWEFVLYYNRCLSYKPSLIAQTPLKFRWFTHAMSIENQISNGSFIFYVFVWTFQLLYGT